mmetsp:Transcript_4896/g.10391  ORF Transcript_4896/g.10391 Transcript_4896/m.10391 type:complete len:709 (-) Transcript_4896:2449-4575(-)
MKLVHKQWLENEPGDLATCARIAAHIWMGEVGNAVRHIQEAISKDQPVIGPLYWTLDLLPKAAELKRAVAKGLPVEGGHFLYLAFKTKNLGMARALLEVGVPHTYVRSTHDEKYFPVLMAALEMGREGLSLLKEFGADLEEEVENWMVQQQQIPGPTVTPLGLAILLHHNSAVDALLEEGASATWPVMKRSEAIEAGVDPLKIGRLYTTTMREELMYRRSSYCVRTRVREPDLVRVSRSLEALSPLFIAVKRENLDVAEKLLAKGAHPNYSPANRDTCVLLALSQGQLSMAALLIQHGANVYTYLTPVKRYTPRNLGLLSLCCCSVGYSKEKQELANTILVRGGALFQKEILSVNGWSPVHVSAQKGSVFVLQKLMASGADPNFVHGNMPTPLQKACSSSSPMTARILLESGANPYLHVAESPPLVKAFKSNSLECVMHLREFGVKCTDVNEGEKERILTYIERYMYDGNGIRLAHEWLQMGGTVRSIGSLSAAFGVLDAIDDVLTQIKQADEVYDIDVKRLDKLCGKIEGRYVVFVPVYMLNISVQRMVAMAGYGDDEVETRRLYILKEHHQPSVFSVLAWRLRSTIELFADVLGDQPLTVKVLCHPSACGSSYPSILPPNIAEDDVEELDEMAFFFGYPIIRLETTTLLFRELDEEKRATFVLCMHMLAKRGFPKLTVDIIRKILFIHEDISVDVCFKDNVTTVRR